MTTAEASLMRVQLECRFIPLRMMSFEAPSKGWIKTIRQSLGMAGRQLGARMGVGPARIARIEHDELAGATTLKTMQQTAAAMKCTFVYAVVPAESLNQIVLERARRKVALRSDLDNQQDHMVQQIMFGPLQGLWDDSA